MSKPAAANVARLTRQAHKKHLPVVNLVMKDFHFLEDPKALKLKPGLPKHCVIYGKALEYAIELVVMKLIKKGYKIWIPVDAVSCINEENREKVLIEMRKEGAEMWNTAAILEEV